MAEIDTSKIEAYIPLIDDRSEETISSQAQDLIRFLSNNQLNDFTDGNPLGVLVRALSFAQAEFLYRTNKLPLSLLLTFLASAGVTRTPATKAVASVTFTLSSPRNIPYQIPAGFEIVSISNNLRFFTKNVLTFIIEIVCNVFPILNLYKHRIFLLPILLFVMYSITEKL